MRNIIICINLHGFFADPLNGIENIVDLAQIGNENAIIGDWSLNSREVVQCTPDEVRESVFFCVRRVSCEVTESWPLLDKSVVSTYIEVLKNQIFVCVCLSALCTLCSAIIDVISQGAYKVDLAFFGMVVAALGQLFLSLPEHDAFSQEHMVDLICMLTMMVGHSGSDRGMQV